MHGSTLELLNLFGWGCVALMALFYLWCLRSYRASQYGRQVKRGFFRTLSDDGSFGEYKLGCAVERVLPGCRLLFNAYVPNGHGSYTECDCVAIYLGLVIVFEMKNYSGWIFGRERDVYWTQSLNPRVRNRFLNPIRQNSNHVKALAGYLEVESDRLAPVVVFSNHCELKKVDVSTCPVVRLGDLRTLLPTLVEGCAGSTGEDLELYNRLYPLTQVSDEVKKAHGERISAKMSRSKTQLK